MLRENVEVLDASAEPSAGVPFAYTIAGDGHTEAKKEWLKARERFGYDQWGYWEPPAAADEPPAAAGQQHAWNNEGQEEEEDWGQDDRRRSQRPRERPAAATQWPDYATVAAARPPWLPPPHPQDRHAMRIHVCQVLLMVRVRR